MSLDQLWNEIRRLKKIKKFNSEIKLKGIKETVEAVDYVVGYYNRACVKIGVGEFVDNKLWQQIKDELK